MGLDPTNAGEVRAGRTERYPVRLAILFERYARLLIDKVIVGVLGAVLCGSALSLSTPGSCNLAGYIPLIHSSSMSSFTLIICSMFLVKNVKIQLIHYSSTTKNYS